MGALLKKTVVAGVGEEEMEEMPPSSHLLPWSYLQWELQEPAGKMHVYVKIGQGLDGLSCLGI